MATKSITFRLEEEIVERVDLLAEALSKRVPAGMKVDRSDALRVAILSGLEVEEEKLKKPV